MVIRRVYEPPAPIKTSRGGNPRNEWWQKCRPEEFKERVDPLSPSERLALLGEIKGACAVISITVQSKDADPEHRARARAALGFVTEKRRILQARIERDTGASKDARQLKKMALAQEARTALDDGDVAGAVSKIIDWLDYFSGKESEPQP